MRSTRIGRSHAQAVEQAVTSVCASDVEKLLATARLVYDKIDVDGSGSVTGDEVAALAAKMGRRLDPQVAAVLGLKFARVHLRLSNGALLRC